MDIGVVFQHFWISGVAAIIGIALGNLAGHPLELLIKRVRSSNHSHKIIFYLVPWRAILAGLAALNIFPAYPFRLLHAGWKLGVFNTAFIIFLCVLALIIHINILKCEEPSDRRILISFYRSTVVLAPILLIYYGFSGAAGGVGFQLYYSIMLSESPSIWIYLFIIILVIDLLSGLIQYYLVSFVENLPRWKIAIKMKSGNIDETNHE